MKKLKRIGFLALVLAFVLSLAMCTAAPAADKSEGGGNSGLKADRPLEELFWNVDRTKYAARVNASGIADRTIQTGGVYNIKFAGDNRQVTFKTNKRAIVESVDMQYVMGVEADDEGNILAFHHVGEYGLTPYRLYVKKVDGNTLTCNTSPLGKGVNVTVQIGENTKVYDVSTMGDGCGQSTQLKLHDELLALRNDAGEYTHLYAMVRMADLDLSHENHCVCGGVAGGMGDHKCQIIATWEAWGDEPGEKNCLPTDSGNYYLVDNVNLRERHSFTRGNNVNICLNGKKITANCRMMAIYGQISFCDCKFTKSGAEITYQGSVSTTYSGSNAYGGMFYVYDGQTLNVYGGQYLGTGTVKRGGLIYHKPGGTTNLYAPVFSGAKVDIEGALIFIEGGNVSIYGGEYTGGKAPGCGGIFMKNGNLYIAAAANIHDNDNEDVATSGGTLEREN